MGLSDKPDRDSYHVAAYLQRHGYRIIPVNPAVKEVLGEKAYARLEDVPDAIDVVDVFRRPDAVPEVAASAVAVKAKTLWLQEGVVHAEAADEGAGGRAAGGDGPLHPEGARAMEARSWSVPGRLRPPVGVVRIGP